MAPLLIRDSEGEITTVHFGIQTKPGENLVMIKQESQAVIISKENWPDIKAAIDRQYKNKTPPPPPSPPPLRYVNDDKKPKFQI